MCFGWPSRKKGYLNLKVVILCGGQGTRLREETEYRPKPMVDVGGRPILWHIMKLYAHYGLNEFVLCLGYRGNVIKDYFLNYQAINHDFTIKLGNLNAIEFHGEMREQDFRVTLVDTGAETMTGGRLRRVRTYLGNSTFCVTYGDGLSDVNISRLLNFHRKHGKLATVTTFRPTSRFGVVEVEPDGQVTSFNEKPTGDQWVNAGFFVFEPAVLDYLDSDECVLEKYRSSDWRGMDN